MPRYLTFSNAHPCDDYLCPECYHESKRSEPGSSYSCWQNKPLPGQRETDRARHIE